MTDRSVPGLCPARAALPKVHDYSTWFAPVRFARRIRGVTHRILTLSARLTYSPRHVYLREQQSSPGPAARPASEGSRVRRPAFQAAPRCQPPLWAAVAVGAAIVVYARSISGGFIWDDPFVLQQLRAIQSLRDLLTPPPIIPRFYFRPLIFVSYLFDRALGGEAPFWFHVSVLVFPTTNVVLAFVLARRLFADERMIAVGGSDVRDS